MYDRIIETTNSKEKRELAEQEKREREEYIERKYSQDNKGVKVY